MTLPSDPIWLLVGAGAAVLVLAIAVLWLSSVLQGRTGLSSSAEIVASDTGQNRVELIEDPGTGLRGQPDYVLQERVGIFRRKKLVPVELKPTRKGRTLHESDEMQIVVYMLLMRARYGRRFAGYGHVRYKDETFTVRLTRERENRCLSYAEGVRQARVADNVDRNHDVEPRCGYCALRDVCDQALA